MKKIFVLILMGFVFVVNVNAQSEQNNETSNTQAEQNKIADNKRTSLYLHPIFLIAGLATEDAPLLLYSTIEIPSSLSNSLIIRPSLWYIPGYNNEINLRDAFRFGSDIGIRHFPSGKGEGLYLQAQSGIFYLSADNKSSLWFDVMGYIGYAKKYSGVRIFIDVGIGIGFVESRGLLGDVNLGIGFPIGK